MRTIRGSGGVDEFVPSLAVFFAFVMSLAGVGVLIYFLHHIASTIQASNIIASSAHETNAPTDRLLPEKQDQMFDEDEGWNLGSASHDEREWYPVPAAKSGYIQSVDNSELLLLARDRRTIVRMERGTGAFVVQNTALVSLALTYPPEEKTIDALNAAYSIGRYRTVEQDPLLLRRISLSADNPPKPWRRRVCNGGTTGSAPGAPLKSTTEKCS